MFYVIAIIKVKSRIASHQNATKEALDVLMKDDDEDIKKLANNMAIKKGFIEGKLEQTEYQFCEKVEPGGIAVFGELNQDQIEKVISSKQKGKMNQDILDLKDNGEFRTCWGIFIGSDEEGISNGEEAFHGLVELDISGAIEIPKDDSTDKPKDGYYFCALSLSKVTGGTSFLLPPGERF